jgi:ribosomal-protein-alanine N-acetyltransferase
MADADLDQVMALEQAIFPEPWGRECFPVGSGRPGVLNLVAESEGRVAGYVMAWGRERLHLVNIAVAPEFRGKGLGRKLMAAAEEFGRSTGAGLLWLEVRESNRSARSFYQSLGFVSVRVKKQYYPNGEDAILMKREILPAPGSATP